jgi:hypothetical protein
MPINRMNNKQNYTRARVRTQGLNDCKLVSLSSTFSGATVAAWSKNWSKSATTMLPHGHGTGSPADRPEIQTARFSISL